MPAVSHSKILCRQRMGSVVLHEPADITGKRFGFLTVVRQIPRPSISYRIEWECRCDCGETCVRTASCMRQADIPSCGCMRYWNLRIGGSRCGRPKTHGLSSSRLYRIYSGMFTRCYNKNNPAYRFYGARGVTICEQWHDFINFSNWAIPNGYADNLTIDRIKNELGYAPDNCRWATRQEQWINRRPRGTIINMVV